MTYLQDLNTKYQQKLQKKNVRLYTLSCPLQNIKFIKYNIFFKTSSTNTRLIKCDLNNSFFSLVVTQDEKTNTFLIESVSENNVISKQCQSYLVGMSF